MISTSNTQVDLNGRSSTLGEPRGGAEQLRAALRVVDRKLEHHRRDGSEHSARVVPDRLALHGSAEEQHPRPDHHLQRWAVAEHVGESGAGIERGREVGIPIPDELGIGRQRPKEPAAHRLSLADVPLEVDHDDPMTVGGPDFVQPIERSVGAPIIDENEPHGGL